MNKWLKEHVEFVKRLKEDLEHDDLENLIRKYECTMKDETLYIYKAIPVTDFIKIRKELRDRKKVDNIIVEG